MIRKFAPYILLAVICAALFFVELGATPLIGLDEALYAECSREMAASGNYIVPTYNGIPFFDKPPLGYWLQAASIHVFGVNSFAVRLPSALCALLVIGLIVFLGIRLYSRSAGLFAGFALATAIYTLPLARLCSLDMLFTLTITAALGAFLLTHLGLISRWGYLGFWAATGLSVMAKGPAGAVLIGLVVGTFLVVRRVSGINSRNTEAYAVHLIGLVIFVAIALPWYVMVQRETGGAFLREFIVHQNLQRAMGKDFHHNMPFYSYLPIYLAGFFPWSLFVAAAWSRYVRSRPKDGVEEASLFAAVWIIMVAIVFSAAKSKLPSYIYPTYPPSALIVGLLWARAVEEGKTSYLRRCTGAALVVAVILGAAFIMGPKLLPRPIPGLMAALVPMGLCLVAGALAAFLMLRAYSPSPQPSPARGEGVLGSFNALCMGMVGFLAAAALVGMPIAGKTMADQAVMIGSTVEGEILRCAQNDKVGAQNHKASNQNDKECDVYSYNLKPELPSLPFYSTRPVIPKYTPEELSKAIEESRECVVIAQRDRIAGVPKHGRILVSKGNYVIYHFNK